MKFKKAFIALLVPAMGFSYGNNRSQVDQYYNLKFLKSASYPAEKQIMRISPETGTQKVVRGILFTYKDRHVKKAEIAGNFSNWRGIRMERGDNGVWFVLISDYNNGDKIRYKFIIDGIWTNDPVNIDREDDGIGSYVSVVDPVKEIDGKNVTYRITERNRVEFRIYNPRASFISIVGDFNHWNPENDILRKGTDGIWRLKKHIPLGKYKYKYIIDGKWTVDIYNSATASDDSGSLCSLLEVLDEKEQKERKEKASRPSKETAVSIVSRDTPGSSSGSSGGSKGGGGGGGH
jgi:1,4-alpha-glucan branching enzyme